MKLQGILVCIWDFDGTLYKQIPQLWDNIRESEYHVIADHTGWPRAKVVEEFKKVYKVVTPSGTKSVSLITGIPIPQAAQEMSGHTQYESYLHPDPELPRMFDALSAYTHYMLVNGSVASVERGLSLLNVKKEYFSEIVTSDIVGESKPSLKGFEYIMSKTRLAPAAHLMIGDREPVDLAPAKSVGMKTCLVWSDVAGTIADVTLHTVYALTDVLG
ncbi:MAG: HAD family hydrolase [Pseudomonadota bacterium]